MSIQPASIRHGDGCACHACKSPVELTAATPASELELEQPGRLDPTGTTPIARDLARFLRGRIGDLNSDVRELIVETDAFGLGESEGRWADLPRMGQITAFDDWLESAANRDVLGRLDTDTVRAFFEQAARQGIDDGHADLERFGVTTDDVDDVLSQDRIREQISDGHDQLRTRVGRAVDDYRSDARRIAGAGLGAGAAKRTIAQNIGERASVYQSHVTSQASGEVVNTYSTTQLTAYDRVDEDIVLETEVEWVDAGDRHVCDRCLNLSGQEWSLERAQNEQPIPMHDGCRCRFEVVDVRNVF